MCPSFAKGVLGIMDMSKFIGEATAYDKKLMLERKEPLSCLKSISAFANASGGVLLYGVDNDGNLVGLENAVRVAKTLASAPERSYKAGLKDGEAKGKEAGLREGKEKLLLAAHNLKAMNLAVEQIAKATGLTVEEVVSS